ncbi:MAG: sodium:solute symporter family protein [Armatimonadetes bacterium]|nr:sodium:solute symporter family protein [Armatimonadota bacterium]MDE2207213.1 sodium:solute symporter family protein [Armatimonadota bacterium]
MHLTFNGTDWFWVALYVAFLLVAGFGIRRETVRGWLIAENNLGPLVFVATLVATWYGAVLGAGEFVYTDGLSAWVVNGLPYYLFGLLFAFGLARRVRAAGATNFTIPDKLAEAYGKPAALLGAALTFIYASPSQYALMAALLFSAITGLPVLPAMLLAVLFSVVYVFRGGFLADVRVNTVQFTMMFAGFTLLAWVCIQRFGGVHALLRPGALPKTHLAPLGVHSIGWALVWFFIALTTLVDPGFHQRCYAARSGRIAVWGIVGAVCCWMVFDALTTFTGLFSRKLAPGLPDALYAFPALAQRALPHGLKGFFVVGMLAPIMASLVSYTFIAGVTVGRDLLWRIKPELPEHRIPSLTRWGLFATSALAIGIAIEVPSVVQQWYAFGNVYVPALLLPLLGAYAPSGWRPDGRFALWGIATGGGSALVSLLWGWRHGGFDAPEFLLGWQPMYLGLAFSSAIYGFGLAVKRSVRTATP